MNLYANKNDIATIWTLREHDVFGNPVFNTPTTQRVRWNEEQTKFITADGDEAVSRAVVVLSEPVAPLDWIAFGDMTAYNTPTKSIGAYQVRGYSRVTNLRNSDNIMKAFI